MKASELIYGIIQECSGGRPPGWMENFISDVLVDNDREVIIEVDNHLDLPINSLDTDHHLKLTIKTGVTADDARLIAEEAGLKLQDAE